MGQGYGCRSRHGCVWIINMILDWMRGSTLDEEQAHSTCRRMMTIACEAGQLQVVKELLDEAQPYACRPNDENGKFLETAARHGHVDIVKELLDPSREHCAKANQDNEALEQAIIKGHAEVLQELLNPLRPNHAVANADSYRMLSTAIMDNQIGCVRVLLDTSRDSCAAANADDNASIMLASMFGRVQIAKELLDTSRPNHAVANARGSAALTLVTKYCRSSDMLRELLWREHHPADPLSPAGDQALEDAVTQGNLECCRLLLEYPGLPPRHIDKSLLKKAADSKNTEVLALLKEVDKRYHAVSGFRRIYNMVFHLLVLLRGVEFNYIWMTAGLETAAKRSKVSVLQLFYFLFYPVVWSWDNVFAPSRRKSAEQKAAVQNAKYRAAWIKSQEDKDSNTC